MANLGETLKESEIEEMISHADLNKDGQINYDEWVSLIMSVN